MGSGVELANRSAKTRTIDDALNVASALARVVGGGYEADLDDLVCFYCMSQHKEADGVVAETLPAKLSKVTVEIDLIDIDRSSCVPHGCLKAGKVARAAYVPSLPAGVIADVLHTMHLAGYPSCSASHPFRKKWLARDPRVAICILIQTYDDQLMKGAIGKPLLYFVQGSAFRALQSAPPMLFQSHRQASIAAAALNTALAFHVDAEAAEGVAALRRMFATFPGATMAQADLFNYVGRLF